MSKFTHIDASGQPNMVDVTEKKVTTRTAVAQTTIVLGEDVIQSLKDNNFSTKKGPVFQTAIVAGNMAVKKTSELIPLCHPLAIGKVQIDIDLNDKDEVVIECMVLSLIHISEPTRPRLISYAVFCL